jgi:mycothiol synthase
VAHPTVEEVAPARFGAVEPLVARINDAARAADGHPSLGDAVWLDLEHPAPGSAGFLVDASAYAHVAPGDNADPPHWSLGLALDPIARTDGTRAALVSAALRHVAAHGGGLVVSWMLGASASADADLRAAGMQPARELFEMRVALPLAEARQLPAGVRLRAFEPGRDDAAWLEVNNRAFHGHAEQGGWTASTLVRRTAERWFDPQLFLLAVDAQGIVGFDWLKIHEPRDPDPPLGEIYVIGVDPRGQGTGLGRALAVAGLEAVHERGVTTGMLFCAADNTAALALYRSLGFAVHRVDRAYECEVAPE